MRIAALLPLSAGLVLAACGGASDESSAEMPAESKSPAHNTLTAAEREEGWELLFDGETTDGWRRYGGEDMPETWVVQDGVLALLTEGGNMDGGDIVTVEEYTDFELVFDFRVGPEGNSGVFFRAREAEDKGLWQVAPEYQVLDDPAYIESGSTEIHLTGANYDLHPPMVRPLNPTGEWNTGRIVGDGNHVEHWLNGEMTVEYELYSPEWEALVADSKFGAEEHYARAPSGSIGLQDHGTPVWYRNIKIRRLDG